VTVTTNKGGKDALPSINERIKAEKLQLIGHDGKNLGIVSKREALHYTQELGLDLVIIAEGGPEGVPVAKVMDFGKSLYDKKKKQGESKKHQKVIQVKEVKLRPKISDHDFDTKIKQALQFLEEGKRVKVTLFFRGRERISKDESGEKFFDRIEAAFADQGHAKNLIKEKEGDKTGSLISRLYYLKNLK
jgi:translation initiation factor IF-3